MDQKKIDTLIQEAITNTDSDIQYMKAQELTIELTIYYEKGEQGMEDEKNQKLINNCYNVFYQHLQSQYRNIQGKMSQQYKQEMQVEQIFEGYFQTQNEQNKINLDNINQYAEILEIQQLTINYIISNLHARSFDLQLIDQITPLIDFDPLGVAAKEEKNPYDDEYYPVKVSDSTWRVRRLLSALFGPNQIIMKRINEKMLKSNYQLLISLVQASAITKEDINSMEVEQLSLIKQRSIPASISLIELVEQLLDKIQSIFKNDQKQQSLKSESTKLLLAIGQYFYSQIQTSNSCFTQIQINQLLVQLFIIKMNKNLLLFQL